MKYGPFADFNPYLNPGVLVFDNPCQCGICGGKIRLDLADAIDETPGHVRWVMIGQLPNVTVQKSVKVIIDGKEHSHFNITNGLVVPA